VNISEYIYLIDLMILVFAIYSYTLWVK